LSTRGGGREKDLNQERNERMFAYLRNLRRPVPKGGGYVTSVELEQDRERYLSDIRNLRTLLINAPSGMAGGYWLGYHKEQVPPRVCPP
jgi:hypothetical protein